MPDNDTAPYIFVKEEPKSFFIDNNVTYYNWDSSDSFEGVEYEGDNNANLLGYINFYLGSYNSSLRNKFLDALTVDADKKSSSSSNQKSIKISMEHIAKLDAIDNWIEISQVIYHMVNHICRLLVKGYTIGINFREVFFVQKGEIPPDHYRPGIDICVDTIEEYNKKTECLSYQFAKSLFITFSKTKSNDEKSKKIVNQYVTEPCATITDQDTTNDYTTPLNEFNYFDSELAFFLQYNKSYYKYNVIAFNHSVPFHKLAPFLKGFRQEWRKEQIIVLKSEQYEDASERQKVYRKAIEFIKQSDCTTLIHIFLITNDASDESLMTLRPNTNKEYKTFQPLDNGIGYYLSPTKLQFSNNHHESSSNDKYWDNLYNILREKHRTKTTCSRPGAYIITKEVSANARKSKNLSKGELKSRINLSINHQQDVAQTQALNEQIEETHTQTQDAEVNQSVHSSYSSSSFFYWPGFSFEKFCLMLQDKAKKELAKISREEQLFQQVYLTQYHFNNHSRYHYYEQLANNEHFRTQIATKLYGTALVPSDSGSDDCVQVTMPHISIDTIDKDMAHWLFHNIEHFLDGILYKERIISNNFFTGKVLYRVMQESIQLPIRPSYPKGLSKFSYLSQFFLHNSDPENCEIPLDYALLLSTDKLMMVEEERRQELIDHATSLLQLYRPNLQYSNKEIKELESYFLELITLHYPEDTDKYQQFERLISAFEDHNIDNLKILLQVIICHDRKGLDDLLKLLFYFEEHSCLDVFYQYYFKYASDINSLVTLFKKPFSTFFMNLVARIPDGESLDDRPAFEKLSFKIMMKFKQNNYNFTIYDYQNLKNFWKELYAKFLVYTGNQLDAQRLLDNLAHKLVDENGLSVSHFELFNTFYRGLSKIIDTAIDKQVLEEQIEEIQGISLLPMDAPYACKWNGFRLICSEMKISPSSINHKTKRYSVTNSELLQAIVDNQSTDQYLKTTTFRYLGGQYLREDIAFYRQLFLIAEKAAEPESALIFERLCSYYVAKFTDNGYCCRIDKATFSNEFIAFLKVNHLAKNLNVNFLSKCSNEFYDHLQSIPTHKQKGMQSLWHIWHEQEVQAFEIGKPPIPEIFLRKFPKKQIGRFLIRQKDDLLKKLSILNNEDKIVWAIFDNWCDQLNITPQYQNILHLYLQKLYPDFNMEIMLCNINQISKFMDHMSALFKNNPQSLIYLVLEDFIEIDDNFDHFISLTELLSVVLTTHYHRGRDTNKDVTKFLLTFSKHPYLYCRLPHSRDILFIALESFLNSEYKGNPQLLLTLAKTLLAFESEQAQTIFKSITPILNSQTGYEFLQTHQYLKATQLEGLTKFLSTSQSSAFPLAIAKFILDKDKENDFSQLNQFVNSKSEEESQILLSLGVTICQHTERDLLDELQILAHHNPSDLKTLERLRNLYKINTEKLLEIINSENVKEAISDFIKQKHLENLARYHLDPDFMKDKIARIKSKSHQTDEESLLSEGEQENLWQDYQTLMSYMTEKPIRFEIGGITKELTINELDEQQFQLAFKIIQNKIKQNENCHDYKLLLIALSAEALYRTTHKFPRCTQILTLLKHLRYPHNIIHEVKTGEGKSIIAALHAVLLCASGHTVDVATENDQLANNALTKFSPFYEYLGIKCGQQIIVPQSKHLDYVDHGINYSTSSSLALFRTRMALAKKSIPNNIALVADEIDATLTSTVQFRLASSLDPLLSNTNAWNQVYQLIIDFVKEKEIFTENYCSEQDDIRNLKNYLIIKKPDKEFNNFTRKISDDILGTLVEAAISALQLEENVDYYIVESKDNNNDIHYYAAPIIANTKRPNPTVNYSEYVQQLLHTLLNSRKPSPKYPFIIEPCSQTLVVTSAKNFFDFYRLNNGPIIGLTGTAGSTIELMEFHEQQGLVAFSYPTYHPDLSEDLGLIAAFGNDDHHKKIFEWIETRKINYPSQPILIITDSPQSSTILHEYLAKHSRWSLQLYHGYEDTGKNEDEVIFIAGKDDLLTVSNQSLARGADIDPDNKNGLIAMNACTNLTSSELRQIQGRAARNGKRGQFISVINMEKIGSASDSPKDLATKFKSHQHDISLKRQKERAKTRLLEDTRNIIVDQYILKLREKADAYITRQFGEFSSIASYTSLLETLSSFNQHAESHYAALLEKYGEVNDNFTDEFLLARISDHNSILDTWFHKDTPYSKAKFIEPTIPLDSLHYVEPRLQNVTVEQLISLSDIFHSVWKVQGHQQTKYYFDCLDELVELFQPYSKNESSFKNNLGQVLDHKGYLDSESIKSAIQQIIGNINDMIDYANNIPIVGYLVPSQQIKSFFSDYLENTKKQILEKKWDELDFPVIDISRITNWFDGVGKALAISTLIVGGPIPFLVNRFIRPTITNWIKNFLKKQFVNSESQIAQILIGLDDIAKDLPEAFTALASLSKEENITVGYLLDKFGNLIKNKACILSLTKYFELIERPELIPYIQSIPELTTMLEPYRDKKVDELFHMNVIIRLFKEASRSSFLTQLLKDTPYKSGLERITQLSPNFIMLLGNLSIPEFINLLKVTAHPNFFSCITKLPPNTTYKQLCQWINEIPETLPEESKLAIQSLLDYQNNNDRIAKENKQALINLRQSHTLDLDTLKVQLERLKPKAQHQMADKLSTTESENSSPFKIGVKEAIIFLGITVLIAYNVTHFSIPMALVSLLVVGMITYPYIKHFISSLQNMKNEPLQEQSPTEKTFLPQLSDKSLTPLNTKKNTFISNEISKDKTPKSDFKHPVLSSSNLGLFKQKNKPKPSVAQETSTLAILH